MRSEASQPRRPGRVRFMLPCALVGGLLAPYAPGLSVYQITSSSMEPALHCTAGPGCTDVHPDRIIVSKWIYRVFPIKRGDVIVFHQPSAGQSEAKGRILVKRVVAVPGDRIWERQRQVFVNKRPSPLFGGAKAARVGLLPSRTIRSSTYFVLGDNRRASVDSRDFGAVPRSLIIGRAVLTIGDHLRFRVP